MMRSHIVVAQPFTQMPRDALGHAAGVYEDQRSLVLPDQRREAYLAHAPFDAADLNRRQPRLVGEVFLCPAVGKACAAHVRTEPLKHRLRRWLC